MVESYTRCCKIMIVGNWNREKQCSRKGVVVRDGKMFCKQHDPEYIKQKRLKQQQKFNKEVLSEKRIRVLLNMAVEIRTDDLPQYGLVRREIKK